jgi:NAD+ synthase
MMPSPFTAQDSLDDARACAKALGVSYEEISIAPMMAAMEGTIDNLDGLAHENMQSRARGLILMSLSNQTGRMVLTTGNKSEMACGYATLYGDMCGGFNPLKDVYKTKVYELAHWRNKQGAVIPDRILTKAPSAELRANQTDQDSLPPYDVLDDILECLIERDMGVAEITERGHAAETVKKVWKMLDLAEYKRRQSAPGAKITSRSFDRDRRYPITNAYRKTIDKA